MGSSGHKRVRRSGVWRGETRKAVRVWLLGGFRVSVGSRTIAQDAWRLRKAANLVKLLALAPGHRLHREQAMNLLWPDSGRRAASNSLRKALHTARRTLDPDAGSRYLVSEGESLVLCPNDDLRVDTEVFEEAAATALRSGDPATYRVAVGLYAGRLLPEDLYEEWTENKREILRQTSLSLLVELARIYEERGEYETAAEVLRGATAKEPTFEEAQPDPTSLHTLSRGLGTQPGVSNHRLRDEIAAGNIQETPSTGPSQQEVPPGVGKHNLPVPRTSFVGREQEMVEVKRMLAMTRVLTLTGAGGSGKTRLALEVARDLVGAYQDGVWLVELAPVSEGELVPQAVATVLGVPERSDQPLTEALVEATRGREMLLLLDNCEHLVEATTRLVDVLLDSCPRLRVLATSREALDVEGEVRWLVPSLSVPGPRRALTVEELESSESARLFLERTRQRDHAFSLTPQHVHSVAEICRRLDGIPLAIEMAAARMGTLSVEHIAERLENSLQLLTAGNRTAAPRHQTLRATLDWSYELLSASERGLLGRFSVFAGGWTLEAAEAVGKGGGARNEDVVDLLSRLMDKSLVVTERVGDGVRYGMLEPVRQYAREKLEQGEGAEAVRRRHVEFFLALAEGAEPELIGPKQAEWFRRLEEELDNLRAALSWAPEHGQTEPALRMGAALWAFWIRRAHYAEGRRSLETALEKGSEAPVLVRAKASHVAGILAAGQYVLRPSQTHLGEALALYRRSGHSEGIAISLGALGILAKYRGDNEQANRLYNESFSRFQRLGDPGEFSGGLRSLAAWQLVCLYWGLAEVHEYDGDPTRALELAEEALALNREMGDRAGVADSLYRFGKLAWSQGDGKRALALCEESLGLAREVYLGLVPHILGLLGEIAREQGDYERATTSFQEALAIHHESGIGPTSVLQRMVRLAAAMGDDVRAARLWGAGETALQTIGAALTPAELALYEPFLDAARSRLGEVAWEAARAEGKSMGLEEAVDYALSEEVATTPTSPVPATLTRREEEVASLVVQGMTNRRVAGELSISEHTAATHVRRIFKKLGLHSRAELATWVSSSRPPLT
jgi:predicted ATPase/DNA-binding SARP family transcriptional activator/DNA-binding CsgD family transcriptional regulator